MVVKRLTDNLAELRLTVRQVWGIVALVAVTAATVGGAVHVVRSDVHQLKAEIEEWSGATRALTEVVGGIDKRVVVVESDAVTRDGVRQIVEEVEVRLRSVELLQREHMAILRSIAEDLRGLKRGGGS